MLKLMRRRAWKKAELAKRLEESPQTLNNWISRGAIPGRKLPKVARVLGVTVEALLSDKPPGADVGLKEEPGSYDVGTLHLVRAIESQPPRDRAHFRWLLTRLLNRPS